MNKGGNKKSNATAPAATSSSSAAANSASARKSTGNSNNNNNNTSNTTPASEERSFLSANFYVIIAAILFGLLLYGLGGEDVDNLPTVTSTTQQALQSQQQQTVDSASTATATDDAKAAAANLQRMSLTDADKAQIKARGSTVEEVERQLGIFRSGFQFTKIVRPTSVGDGILKLTDQALEEAVQFYDKEVAAMRTIKFVPASGAASRMFKSLFSFMESYDDKSKRHALMSALEAGKPADMVKFFASIKQFAFYADLDAAMSEVGGVEKALAEKRHGDVLRYLLTDKGLDYGDRPKGLLRFHIYHNADGSVERRVPVEEHLVEGAQHARSSDGTVHLHFTVSPQHLADFKATLELVRPTYEARYDCKYVVEYSEQKPSTDTVSVDPNNAPFRTDDGKLLFRPAGHGALIENLKEIDADIIFVKNIDNVVPDTIKPTTIRYKKAVGGVLIRLRRRVEAYLTALEGDASNAVSDARLGEIATFVSEELGTTPPPKLVGAPRAQRVAYLLEKLRRPLRACGMVPAAGETGGGPFWTLMPDGGMSMQIVETAQINVSDAGQAAIMAQATHFNPVDLACCTKKRDGTRYDLPKYVDPLAAFISSKSLNGRELKALELPGLWNGGMSDWVKVVNDLLRKEHQN